MDDWAPQLEPAPQSPITEEYDPTWPYTFKWGVSHEGRTDVWRTHGGGLDGMPTHRGELTQLWGRAPQFRDGDQMGMAQYIPAEKKLDGTLVAPPVVLLHAYYGLPTPQSVFDWFEQQFPNTVVRTATVTNDMKGRPVKLAEWAPTRNLVIVRWIWNEQDGLLVWESDEEGVPTHDQKARAEWGRLTGPGDYLGYADVGPDEIEIDPIKHATPSVAIAAVKSELAKLYPDKQISSGQDLAEQYGVEFHGDPAKVARQEAAAQWAQENLADTPEMPLERAVSDAQATVGEVGPATRALGFSRYFTIPSLFTTAVNKGNSVKNAGADMSGAMVAIFIPEEAGKKIKIKDGEPLEMMHTTLLYFEDKFDDRDDWDEVAKIVAQIAKQSPPLSGKISGYGVFNNDEDVLWAVPSLQGLASLREKLFRACEDAGFTVSKTHDWAPHITLKYDFKGKLPKIDDEIKLDITELSFAHGNNRDDFKFEGHFEKNAAEWGPQEWSGWTGAHRFVTDGKEIVTDPDDGRGEDLFAKFRSLYPDAQHIVDGRVIPTADDMGYGVHAPTLGWTHASGPQIHDVIALLDKHFEKPTHLVEDEAALSDTDRYRREPEHD